MLKNMVFTHVHTCIYISTAWMCTCTCIYMHARTCVYIIFQEDQTWKNGWL